ncbi:MAG: hypothetical protein ACE5F5_09215 [Acidimicrobiia bacterium]
MLLSSWALHKSWVVFVGTFFLGESVVLASAALAAQGTWSVTAVAGWAFAGTIVADTVWFRSARLGIERWTTDPVRASKLAEASSRLDRVSGAHPHRALLFVKFLYGSRIASIVYMALRQVQVKRFVLFSGMGTALWLAVMIPIGWAIGMGFGNLGVDLRNVERAILGVVLAGVVVKGVTSWRARLRA